MVKKTLAIILIVSVLLPGGCASQNISQPESISSSSYHSSFRADSSETSAFSESSGMWPAAEISDYSPQEFHPSASVPEKWEDIHVQEPLKREISAVQDTITVNGEYADIFPLITNQTPLVDVMSPMDFNRMTAIQENCEKFYIMPEYHITKSIDFVPIGFLRQVEDGRYYSVNKLYDGGYAYFFFEHEMDPETLEYVTEDLTDVYLTGCVYMEKKLAISDFSGLEIGDSIDKVIAVDNAASVLKEWADWYKSILKSGFEDGVTKHILADGLLVIYYDYNGKELVIGDMEFSEDFVFENETMGIATAYPKKFSILPQDYPPES